MKIHHVFQVSLLRRYVSWEKQLTNTPVLPTLIGDQEKFETIFFIKKLIWVHKYPKVEYLVQSKGNPSYISTWKPVKNLTNAPLIVQEFEQLCNEYVPS